MEDRAVERLHQIEEYWMPYVQSPVCYPNDVTFTDEELETIKRYKADFTSQVAEYEGTWLKNGGPSDAEWTPTSRCWRTTAACPGSWTCTRAPTPAT